MTEVDGVSGTCVVDVVAPVGGQAVIRSVVDTLERQRWPKLIAFSGVVVNDVEDDLDAGTMKLRHHFLEFVDEGPGEVPGLGREKSYRVVTPVVSLSLLH